LLRPILKAEARAGQWGDRDSRDIAEQGRLASFFDWLSRHNIKHHGTDDFDKPWYVGQRYGSNIVHLAVDAMAAAHNGDRLVVLAGDAKLIPLFRQLRRDKVQVSGPRFNTAAYNSVSRLDGLFRFFRNPTAVPLSRDVLPNQ
jgi:hypothetical protein